MARRPPRQYEVVRTPSKATEFILQRGPMLTNQELVAELNAAGFQTGTGRCFDVAAIQWVRHAYHIPPPPPLQAGELSVDDVAAQLGISVGVVYYWIEHDQLAARRTANGRLGIAFTPEVEAACRKRIAGSHRMKLASQKPLGAVAV